MKKIWLSKDYLYENVEWNNSGSSIESSIYKERAYEIWNRANILVENNESLFDLTDGITNLKRSINHRLKSIEKIYNFKKIVFLEKPKGYLELLENFNIIKPYLIKIIMEIRNLIEHEDSPPPSQQRCKELVDMVWYFLKSTDSLVSNLITDFEFVINDCNGEETPYGGTIELDYKHHKSVKIFGWFPLEVMDIKQKKDGFICIYSEDINTKDKWKNIEYHRDKLDTDLWINGVIYTKDFEYHNFISQLLASLR
ncbi:hypothetical protein KF282_1892 [Lactococcus lactis subsp. lactis]|uniref:Uncharacterized protein n=1 Tax=Lactococcus lactis subsp. lactis TaxID=1360 RepID=A0A0V8CQ44_LACLL|nr:hypothetical protein [Lactococcus lactis]KSU03221.1 hypothetical protein KF282_1892 [Lactococcus lactis subsp. lactis]